MGSIHTSVELYSPSMLKGNSNVGIMKLENRTLKIDYYLIDGWVVVEGDILLGREEDLIKKGEMSTQAIIFEPVGIVRWPNKVVYYAIDSELPNPSRVTQAINEWESKTSMKFVKRENEPNYIYFIKGDGCSSNVGMIGGRQDIRLGDGCERGNVIHEIAHSIGYWHEQSRADRDNFVTIHLENVFSGMEHNFNQHINDGQDVGFYDYDSIMHYPRKAFSKNGLDTIVPSDPNVQIGQRNGLSAKDIQAVDFLYNAALV
ncbi:M12 family metallopeptidase [Paenibacillus polymyxa]|uniref:M12 family metallopeptidase n=1 Tax=Paenibacillus polymyxa TaxID=1406 RepID=UPI002AB5DCB6|nr:M12 family metallopeptidase [Paenibacillus polymyxa]MDY8022014.1 M12 family metallopeptidase [Paenibacillus polymyxa]